MKFTRSAYSTSVALGIVLVAALGLIVTYLMRDAPSPEPRSALTTVNPNRLIVRFGSICCGTDENAVTQIAEIISKYERQITKPIVSQKVHWGFEGEFTLCFTLTELSAPMQDAFVSDVRTTVTSSRVKIEENIGSGCSGGWR